MLLENYWLSIYPSYQPKIIGYIVKNVQTVVSVLIRLYDLLWGKWKNTTPWPSIFTAIISHRFEINRATRIHGHKYIEYKKYWLWCLHAISSI